MPCSKQSRPPPALTPPPFERNDFKVLITQAHICHRLGFFFPPDPRPGCSISDLEDKWKRMAVFASTSAPGSKRAVA